MPQENRTWIVRLAMVMLIITIGIIIFRRMNNPVDVTGSWKFIAPACTIVTTFRKNGTQRTEAQFPTGLVVTEGKYTIHGRVLKQFDGSVITNTAHATVAPRNTITTGIVETQGNTLRLREPNSTMLFVRQ